MRPVPRVGAAQAYRVPKGTMPEGAYAKVTLLQDEVVCEAIVATGFTVTVTLNTVPVQVPGGDVGVTLYTAVTGAPVVLVSTSVIVLLAVPEDPPVTPVPMLGVAHA